MTIYIDKLKQYPASHTTKKGLPGRWWCHMISDTSDRELHDFAEVIGLKRTWAQLPPKSSVPHYDLTPSRRALAVAAGAHEVARDAFVAAIKRRRKKSNGKRTSIPSAVRRG